MFVNKTAVVPAVILLAAAIAGCANGSAEETKDGAGETGQDVSIRVINVEARPVERSDFTDFIRITGEVEAFNDITISAEEPGRVQRFFLEKGQWVRRGAPIVKLDASVLESQLKDARAARELAHERYVRQKELWEKEKIGTEIQYLEAKHGAERAQAQMEVLEERLAKTVIRSPVTGVLDDRYLEVGEMAVAGAPVVRVVATRRMKITGGIPERFASSVTVGDSAVITFDIFPGKTFRGLIRFVGNAVDERNRTFPIEIWLDNPENLVKAHMVANIQVVDQQLHNVVVVPQTAVVRSADGYLAYVVADRDGRKVASARKVELGAAFEGRVVIDSGLDEGDLLISLGQQQVDDGSLIRVVNAGTGSKPTGSE